MLEETKYLNLCRCCTKLGELDIFEGVFDKLKYFEIIQKYTSVTINKNDNLPKRICKSCADNLEILHNFLLKFQEAQKFFLEVIKSNSWNVDINKQNLEDYEELPDTTEDTSFENNLDILADDSSSECKDSVVLLQEHDTNKQIIESSEDKKSPSLTLPQKNENNKCSECNKSFKTKSGLSIHVKRKHTNKKNEKKDIENSNLNLADCEEDSAPNVEVKVILSTGSPSELKLKKQGKGNGRENNYSCTDCGKSFVYFYLLKEHCKETGHTCPKKFACEICSKRFSVTSTLRKHLLTHTKEKPYECEVCGKKFSLRTNLVRHEKLHTGEKTYFCDECGKGFIQKGDLIIHTRIHTGETPYVCEVCGKAYRVKFMLKVHMAKHQRGNQMVVKPESNVGCGVCKKTVPRTALYRHRVTKHGNNVNAKRDYLCNLCGKTYTSKIGLNIHMNLHTKKIAYTCKICSKAFYQRTALKVHMKIHSGDKRYCCSACGKSFVQWQQLNTHMRTHTGVKPYNCSYCNKAFALNGNLKVHMRIHTGETPYHCRACNKGFFDSSSRKKHEINVHQMHHNPGTVLT